MRLTRAKKTRVATLKVGPSTQKAFESDAREYQDIAKRIRVAAKMLAFHGRAKVRFLGSKRMPADVFYVPTRLRATFEKLGERAERLKSKWDLGSGAGARDFIGHLVIDEPSVITVVRSIARSPRQIIYVDEMRARLREAKRKVAIPKHTNRFWRDHQTGYQYRAHVKGKDGRSLGKFGIPKTVVVLTSQAMSPKIDYRVSSDIGAAWRKKVFVELGKDRYGFFD